MIPSPEAARFSMSARVAAKAMGVPFFHVTGDAPLACLFVTERALDFRQEFGGVVVIDMFCYRRYGHNEGDEPSFTQPDLYAKIDRRPSVGKIYKKELIEAGRMSEEEAALLESEFEQKLQAALDDVKAHATEPADSKEQF